MMLYFVTIPLRSGLIKVSKKQVDLSEEAAFAETALNFHRQSYYFVRPSS